jgi:hypothetical protein
MSTDLKPCPFCAGAAILEDERLIFVVRCTGCGACVLGKRAPEPEEDLPDGHWEPFRQSAIDCWNRRTALAQPEPVGATDAQIMELMPEQMHEDLAAAARALAGQAMEGTDNRRVAGMMRIILNRHAVDLTRAVLARYGRPTITPVPVSATADDDYRENWNIRSESGSLCFASAIYARLVGGEQDESELLWLAGYLRVNSSITPIPVSERLPEEEDCDAEGRCWFWEPDCDYNGLKWALVDRAYGCNTQESVFTHWLPFHALPLPSPNCLQQS